MIANHIHDALAQVRRLQEFILSRNQFRGYSGKARIASGTMALLAAALLSTPSSPVRPGSTCSPGRQSSASPC